MSQGYLPWGVLLHSLVELAVGPAFMKICTPCSRHQQAAFAPCRLASAFLAGAAGVPLELLSCVSPVLLAVTFEHLPHADAQATPVLPSQQAPVRVWPIFALACQDWLMHPSTMPHVLLLIRRLCMCRSCKLTCGQPSFSCW